ncbi:MAG: hypothetical protein M1400_02820 [Patescibacteria group bacterium]|nr:hypothetical protein [Patescibacteria group bacterium]
MKNILKTQITPFLIIVLVFGVLGFFVARPAASENGQSAALALSPADGSLRVVSNPKNLTAFLAPSLQVQPAGKLDSVQPGGSGLQISFAGPLLGSAAVFVFKPGPPPRFSEQVSLRVQPVRLVFSFPILPVLGPHWETALGLTPFPAMERSLVLASVFLPRLQQSNLAARPDKAGLFSLKYPQVRKDKLFLEKAGVLRC